MDERRSEKRCALRGRVSALYGDLLAVRRGDREAPQLRRAVNALAVEARRADVPPERLLVVLKRVTKGCALEHVGFFERIVLGERCVQWGIASYYRSDEPV